MLLIHSWRRITKASKFVSVLHVSGLVACIGILVHSFVDFNLHIPANALLFFLTAVLATSEMEVTKTA